MTLLWTVTFVSLALAVASWAVARRTARRLAELTDMYWQLKCDHGELKAKVAPTPVGAPESKQTFVPLSAIRKA